MLHHCEDPTMAARKVLESVVDVWVLLGLWKNLSGLICAARFTETSSPPPRSWEGRAGARESAICNTIWQTEDSVWYCWRRCLEENSSLGEMAAHNVATWSLVKCYMKWPPPAYLCNNVGLNSALAPRPNPGFRSFIMQQNPISRGTAPCSRQCVHVKACSSEVSL